MPLMSTLSPQATLTGWLLRAAELSDAEPSWSHATFTFYDDASASPRLRAEGEDALPNSADTDSCASEHDDDGPRAPAPIPPFPPVRELHPSLRSIIQPFPPLRKLHPSLRALVPVGADATRAQDLAGATWAQDLAGPRAPVFFKPERSGDASDARKTYTLVIKKNEETSASDATDSGSDELTQYSSDREDYVSDEDGIEITPEEDALYYASEPEDDDDRSQDIIAKEDEEDSGNEADCSDVDLLALQYRDSDDFDVRSQRITAKEDNEESDNDGDDEDGALMKRYCSDDDQVPPPQKRRKLGHEPAAHAAGARRFPLARTRGRALRRTGSATSLALW